MIHRWSAERYLRFHSSLRWTTDLDRKLSSDPQLFVYDAYAQLAGVIPRSDIYLGRQFVYSGAGSVLLDGARLQVRPADAVRVQVFGGSSVSSDDPEDIRSFGDYLVLGSRISIDPTPGTRLGLAWTFRRSQGDQAYNRVGVDVQQLFNDFEILASSAYNAADLRLARILGRLSYRPRDWYVSAEFLLREPSVASNTIFTLVDFDRYKIARGEIRRRVYGPISITAQVHADMSSDDDTWRAGVGLAGPFYSISWIHQTGYAGDNDGVSGYVNYTLAPRWDVYASANLYQYRIQDLQEERSDAYATALGLQWRAGSGFTVRTEAQYLRNAVEKNDYRLFLRFAKDFALRPADGGGL
jgi:hypothetical protein